MPDQLSNLITRVKDVLNVYTDDNSPDLVKAEKTESALHEAWLEFLVSVYPSKMTQQSFRELYRAYTWKSVINEDDYTSMLDILDKFEFENIVANRRTNQRAKATCTGPYGRPMTTR